MITISRNLNTDKKITFRWVVVLYLFFLNFEILLGNYFETLICWCFMLMNLGYAQKLSLMTLQQLVKVSALQVREPVVSSIILYF